MDKPESPAKLVKQAVNIHGELHLDRERTAALVRWMEIHEAHIEAMDKQVIALMEACKPIIGTDMFEELKRVLK
jgi:hypothetical protein